MMYQTHLLGGACAGLLVAEFTGAAPQAAAGLAALGALLPDIDTPQSKGARILGAVLVVSSALFVLSDGWQSHDPVLLFGGAVIAALAPRGIARCLGHRGPTHSALLVVFLAAVALLAVAATSASRDAAWVITFVTVGYVVGGLGLDACTIRGVPLLWPLHTGSLHLLPRRWRIRTGGRAEAVVRLLVALTLIPLCHALGSP